MGERPTIEADPTPMRQRFQNWIGNALKFHRKEIPPVVTIAATLRQGGSELQTETAFQGRKYCVMEIKDNL